jgi:hypothetical protein
MQVETCRQQGKTERFTASCSGCRRGDGSSFPSLTILNFLLFPNTVPYTFPREATQPRELVFDRQNTEGAQRSQVRASYCLIYAVLLQSCV